jgi:hypothetical protein
VDWLSSLPVVAMILYLTFLGSTPHYLLCFNFTHIQINNITGDASGTLYIQGNQNLTVQSGEVHASVVVLGNGAATFSSSMGILKLYGNSTTAFYGTVCVPHVTEVYGTLALSRTGTTCDLNVPGEYRFPTLILCHGANLTIVGDLNVTATICLFQGANISSYSPGMSLASGMNILFTTFVIYIYFCTFFRS